MPQYVEKLTIGPLNAMFSSRGSTYGKEPPQAKAFRWLTNGMLKYIYREPEKGAIIIYGRGPYMTCAASGYRASLEYMTQVGGRYFISAFAPQPRPGGERAGFDG